jgi:hypothetical protein
MGGSELQKEVRIFTMAVMFYSFYPPGPEQSGGEGFLW